VLLALVLMLPTLVSMGLFRGTVVSAIGGAVHGTVSLGSLRLGWSGPLEVKGLSFDVASSGTRIAAAVSVAQGLWTLVTRGTQELDVRVAGSLRTARMPDGRYEALLERLRARGYALDKLTLTLQPDA
jgi:hypothetical protein